MLKVSDRRRLTALVQETLKDRPEVRPFPAAVSQLLALCQDSNAPISKFEKIIETDPALSVRLLRMANSPLYGLAHEVRSIAHAVSILGLRQLRALAMSVAGASMFSQGANAAQERTALWNHSLGVATLARISARRAPGVAAEEAFLAGIFHDVGKLFLLDLVREEYVELATHYEGDDLIREEVFAFGVSHEEIGLKSAHSWDLAETLKAAIGFHHHPADAPVHGEMAHLIYNCNVLARIWGIGSIPREDDDHETAARQALGLDEDQAFELRQQVELLYQDAARAMSA